MEKELISWEKSTYFLQIDQLFDLLCFNFSEAIQHGNIIMFEKTKHLLTAIPSHFTNLEYS